MPKKHEESLTKIHIHISEYDLARLNTYCCRPGVRVIGRSDAIRKILRHYLDLMEGSGHDDNASTEQSGK